LEFTGAFENTRNAIDGAPTCGELVYTLNGPDELILSNTLTLSSSKETVTMQRSDDPATVFVPAGPTD